MAKLTADALREMFLKFFESKGHTIISGASVIPENDPTVLFTTAGMHPLVPYLLGEPHPAGRRLTDVQKCVRTGDIDAVGDSAHLTFFEMLGNWSLGDYFKKEGLQGRGEHPARRRGHRLLESARGAGGAHLPEGTRGQLVGARRCDRAMRPGHRDVRGHGQAGLRPRVRPRLRVR